MTRPTEVTTVPAPLPLPPMELRALVGPRDDEDFDNPTGAPIYAHLAPEAYRSVFDFGCGCGRTARQLIQQTPRPANYVGVDPHRTLVDWAAANLAPAAPGFAFRHHDVYSPGYAPGNSLRLAEPFPVADASASLVIAHSVFTHLSRDQTSYYLGEVARVLAPDGVAFTTWFLFDNESLPFLPDGPHALYVDEKDFSAAVLYDRRWLHAALTRAGLVATRVGAPAIAGHQWEVWLAPTASGAIDRFPLGDDGAESLCGATRRAMAAPPANRSGLAEAARTGSRSGTGPPPAEPPPAPELYGPLAELAGVRRELAEASLRAEQWRRRALGYRAARKLAGWAGLRAAR